MTLQPREAIFRQWLDQHLGLMLKVARGCAGCASTPEDQEDLFQEILLQLWLSIPGFRGEAKPTTWIYRVALNTALVWRRGERRRRDGFARFLDLDTSPQVAPSHTESLSNSEMVEQIYSAIRSLPKLDAALALLYLDGMSYEDMAEVLGISQNYVGVKLNRIRKQLANQLNQLNGAKYEL